MIYQKTSLLEFRPSISKNVVPEHSRCLRTWVVVADNSTARIFVQGAGGMDFVEKIARTNVASSSFVCSVTSGKKFFLRHTHTAHSIKSSSDPVDFAHRVSAMLDEALWNDRFDQIILLAEFGVIDDIFSKFSLPVSARTLALMHDHVAYLDDATLQKTLQKIVCDTINIWKGERCVNRQG